MSRRQILLNPGPVTMTDRVRSALAREDWCHREPEFAQLTKRILESLEAVYPSEAPMRAVLLTGSGTAAVESMLATLTPRESRTLVAANGVYGERMAAMLRAHGRDIVVVSSPWEQGLDLPAIEAALSEDWGIKTVVTVHHETTTGRLNDVAGLAEICRRRDCRILLDGVSSFGAEVMDFDGWPIGAVAATANKCLHGSPGLSFVLVREDVLESVDWDVGSVYLDLRRYHEIQRRDGFSPFTQAVHVAFALEEALREFQEGGGQPARLARYRTVAARVQSTLEDLGVRTLLPDSDGSAVLRSYLLPEGFDYEELHDRLKAQDFVIYAGQGRLRSGVFRVAHMGDLREDDLEALDAAFREALGGEP
ncbi:MAG: aminotransferase class V-fold PLP-dependent enzyme [Gemmatimonadales bacterium]|nr:MAG: aminotransferase class V-fold PLP-dependent enzyme [Gemmatimonadales bacterium]